MGILITRGILAIIFGLAAVVFPNLTFSVFVILLGLFLILDGLFAFILTFFSSAQPKWVMILEGVVGIALGVLVFFWPGVTKQILTYLIAAWLIIVGGFRFLTGTQVLGGLVSLLCGIFLIFFPNLGLKIFVQLIGLFALLIGTILAVFAVRFLSR